MSKVKAITDKQLLPGNCLIFRKTRHGALKIKEVKGGYVHFEPTFNGQPRSYTVEGTAFVLAHADYWEADLEPWGLEAGQMDDGEPSIKVARGYDTLCALLADLPTVLDYPIVTVTYDRPDGKTIEIPVDILTGLMSVSSVRSN